MNLLREFTRSWLLWRNELMGSGVREADGEHRNLLLEPQRNWRKEGDAVTA